MSKLDFSILRTLRIKKGVSAEDVARATGLTRATVVKVESGEGNPTMSTVGALAEYFKLSSSELIKIAEGSSCEKVVSRSMKRGKVKGRMLSFKDLELFHFQVSAGAEVESDPKLHEHTREVFLVLQGNVLVTVGEEVHELNSGDAIRFKALQQHSLSVLEDSEIVMMHYNV